VGDGGMKVTVTCEEMEVRKRLVKPRFGIGENSFIGVFFGKGVVEALEMSSSAWTLKSLEVGEFFRRFEVGIVVKILEKTTTGFHFNEGAFDTITNPRGITHGTAKSLIFGTRKKLIERSENAFR